MTIIDIDCKMCNYKTSKFCIDLEHLPIDFWTVINFAYNTLINNSTWFPFPMKFSNFNESFDLQQLKFKGDVEIKGTYNSLP